jgi:hypothetical protein
MSWGERLVFTHTDSKSARPTNRVFLEERGQDNPATVGL